MDATGDLPHCVYVLYSFSDGKLYTGYTSDLPRRLTEHFQGRSKSTACRRPLVLLKAEFYRSASDAQRREEYSFADGKLYTGYTSDLPRRLAEHFQGRSKSTSCRRPLVLLKAEFYRAESDARRREEYLKTTAGKKAVRLMVREGLVQVDREQQCTEP